MGDKLRWGVMSTANIAVNAVMPAIEGSETGALAAVASRDHAKAKAVADHFDVNKAYGSYEELLNDADIDAVYIPLPNHLHREWVIRAAEAGKHVLCEKPLALNTVEAEEMVQACAKAGVQLAEAFMYRHHPRMQRIRDIIADDQIGDIRSIRSAFTFNNAEDKGNIRYRADWGGGSLYDVGCYPLSAARYIVGREPEAVTVHAFFSPEHDHVDMMASGLVEFGDGVALTFDCGMWAENRELLEIVGSKGRIDVTHAFTAGVDHVEFAVYKEGKRHVEQPVGVNAYRQQVDHFAKVLSGEQRQLFSPADAVSNMRLMDACLKSARERQRISLI